MRKLQSDKLDTKCVNRSCDASVSQSCLMQCYVIKGKVFPLQARCGPEGG
jgi:hypothetical protein